jgi:ADP-heptose:LPS heptosyltransferase
MFHRLLKAFEIAFRQFIIKKLYRQRPPMHVSTPDNVLNVLNLAPDCRLLLLRQDRIGDVIVSMPVLRALRQAYPEARIDVVLSDNNIAVRQLVLIYANQVLPYSKRNVVRFVRLLRREPYDVVIDLFDNASVTSSFLIRLARTRFAVGIDKENAAAYTHVVPLLDRSKVHIVYRTAQVLMPFGIDPMTTVNLDLEYRLSDNDVQKAQSLLPATHGRKRLGMNVSGRVEAMYWGQENFVRLLEELHRAFPALDVMLMGTPDYASELITIEQTFSNAHANAHANTHSGVQRAVTIAPAVASLHEFAALLHECDAVFTPDTAVVHLAAAWKRPTLALYTYNEFHVMPWTPFQTPHRALQVSEEAWKRGENAVQTIPFDYVWSALQSLLREELYGEKP